MRLYSTFLRFTIFSLGIFFSISALCQQTVDFNKVAPPTNVKVRNFEDFLVQLAWRNNPNGYIDLIRTDIAKDQVLLASREWMNNVSLSINMNEISLSNIIYDYGEDANIFVANPIWNFRASVDLGTLFLRPINKRIAQQQVKIIDHEISLKKLGLRASTLERYQTYLAALKVLKSKTSAEEDAHQTYILIAEKFRTGEADLEQITNASRTFFNNQEGKIRAESEVKIAIIQIEEVIGISFSEAQRMGGHLKTKENNEIKNLDGIKKK